MIIAFPAIVRKQSQLMTPPLRSHPSIAKRLWTRKGKGGNVIICAVLFFIIYTVTCYILLWTVWCVFSFRRQKSTESAGSDEEDVDELTLIDHKEIMSRITLKQEVSWCSYIFLRMFCDRAMHHQSTDWVLSCWGPHRLKSTVTQM